MWATLSLFSIEEKTRQEGRWWGGGVTIRHSGTCGSSQSAPRATSSSFSSSGFALAPVVCANKMNTEELKHSFIALNYAQL